MSLSTRKVDWSTRIYYLFLSGALGQGVEGVAVD